MIVLRMQHHAAMRLSTSPASPMRPERSKFSTRVQVLANGRGQEVGRGQGLKTDQGQEVEVRTQEDCAKDLPVVEMKYVFLYLFLDTDVVAYSLYFCSLYFYSICNIIYILIFLVFIFLFYSSYS